MAERKETNKQEREKKTVTRPENTKFRMAPGVAVITVCASLIFILVYVVAFQANLIPLPGFLQTLFYKGTDRQIVVENVPEDALMPVQETRTSTYYAPEEEDPEAVLSAMCSPEIYHQRIRITRVEATETKTTDVIDLYRQKESWKLIVKKESDTALYQWNGAVLYRENALYPDGIETELGALTPENILGVPTLAAIQSWDATKRSVEMSTEDKVLRVRYQLEPELEWVCRVSLDVALVIEAQLYRNGEAVVVMYTEYFDLAPETWTETID